MNKAKESMKPNVDFCDGCRYLHGDEDGENYSQTCDKTNTAIEAMTECPIDDRLGIDI